jgi:chromate transporter
MTAPPAPTHPLREVAVVFLRLGTLAFGGPAAHIAMMHQEIVRRRRWLDESEFLDLLGATNLLPGPNSTEMALHLGRLRAGWLGLLVAGACFILPAASITTLLAWAYVRLGGLPVGAGVLYGVKPVILVVVLQALWILTPKAMKTWPLRVLGLAAVIASAAGVDELLVLLAAGLVAAIRTRQPLPRLPILVVTPTLPLLFLFFAKVGAVLYGSGYVLLAFLRADVVEHWHWLTEAQLLDAIAAGQVTPGPVFTTATFVGFVVRGPAGAALATLGIFLPAFGFVAVSGPLVPRLRRSLLAAGFLDGVNVASLALMAVVTVQLGRAAVIDWQAALLAVIAAVLLLRLRVNSAWVLAGGALLGPVLHCG